MKPFTLPPLPTGISANPLADDPEDADDGSPPEKPNWVPESSIPFDVLVETVSFTGRSQVIRVGVRCPPEGVNSDTIARAVIGQAIKEILAKSADFAGILERQSLPRKARPGPKTTLELGDITLFPVASSTDHDLAIKMATDRLADALTWAKSHGHSAVLERHLVRISRAAR